MLIQLHEASPSVYWQRITLSGNIKPLALEMDFKIVAHHLGKM